jgi:hypothetical protein
MLRRAAPLFAIAANRLSDLTPPDRLRDRYRHAVRLANREIALIARHERKENAAWRGLGVPACVRRSTA